MVMGIYDEFDNSKRVVRLFIPFKTNHPQAPHAIGVLSSSLWREVVCTGDIQRRAKVALSRGLL